MEEEEKKRKWGREGDEDEEERPLSVEHVHLVSHGQQQPVPRLHPSVLCSLFSVNGRQPNFNSFREIAALS